MYSSFYLIRKDFILTRKYLLLLLLFYMVIGYSNLESYIVSALFPSMLMLMNACSLDVQHNNQRFLVSLPLPRHQLVLAKYLSLLPYAAISLTCTLLIYLAGVATGRTIEPIAWRELLLVIACFPLLASFYFPLYYWLGQKGMQIVNMIFMMLVMIGYPAIPSVNKKFPGLFDWINSATTDNILLWAIGGMAYLFFIYCSYLISLRVFVKKDI
ncbi:ABC-2 transporter permease [Paenibacillus jilunlii]|uniref:ABC-2 type transport system permease protein n=2 Tax=Paenibacillus jilunlii TaxID=682956 RepID=A0A1G9KWV9_9BACL|nr:ABC-2 transporter permease [Paenibacillus jilunlii]SDL54086.1 ABC-2 type transport system permease protein [Paenibacillus jilunlii]